MELTQEIKHMVNIVSLWGGNHIESTSATEVSYSGTLYNVDGSDTDPKLGKSWKQLLIADVPSITTGSSCYVTPATAHDSHPQFNVGGHMTPNTNGKVATGGICYLMPLCSWHNNKARDGVAFSHTETAMLKLSGYMQSELAVTFIARLPSDKPFSLVYHSDGDWHHTNLSQAQAAELETYGLSSDFLDRKLDHYVLLERVMQGDQTKYLVRSKQMPDE